MNALLLGKMERRRAARKVIRANRLYKEGSWSERIVYALYSPCLRSAQTLGRLLGAHASDMAPDQAVLNAWRASRQVSKRSNPHEP
jgi:hypothetical protein